jgi:signal transduction histidine kinase
LSDPSRQVDVALASGAVLLNVVGAARPDPDLAYDLAAGWLPALLGAAAGLALLWRRSHPQATFCVVVTAGAAAPLLGWQSVIPVTILLAGYALGAYGRPRATAVGLAWAGAWFALMFAFRAPYFDSPLGVFAVAQVVVACAVGIAVAQRRRLASLAHVRRLALVRDGAREAEAAVLAERLRLARALQEEVAASLATVTSQAAAGRAGRTGNLRVLAEIESGSRVIAADLRRLLGTLRHPDADPAPAARRPEPSDCPWTWRSRSA